MECSIFPHFKQRFRSDLEQKPPMLMFTEVHGFVDFHINAWHSGVRGSRTAVVSTLLLPVWFSLWSLIAQVELLKSSVFTLFSHLCHDNKHRYQNNCEDEQCFMCLSVYVSDTMCLNSTMIITADGSDSKDNRNSQVSANNVASWNC